MVGGARNKRPPNLVLSELVWVKARAPSTMTRSKSVGSTARYAVSCVFLTLPSDMSHRRAMLRPAHQLHRPRLLHDPRRRPRAEQRESLPALGLRAAPHLHPSVPSRPWALPRPHPCAHHLGCRALSQRSQTLLVGVRLPRLDAGALRASGRTLVPSMSMCLRPRRLLEYVYTGHDRLLYGAKPVNRKLVTSPETRLA